MRRRDDREREGVDSYHRKANLHTHSPANKTLKPAQTRVYIHTNKAITLTQLKQTKAKQSQRRRAKVVKQKDIYKKSRKQGGNLRTNASRAREEYNNKEAPTLSNVSQNAPKRVSVCVSVCVCVCVCVCLQKTDNHHLKKSLQNKDRYSRPKTEQRQQPDARGRVCKKRTTTSRRETRIRQKTEHCHHVFLVPPPPCPI
jgi:hypothetical protein